MQTHKDLDVWKLGMDLVEKIYVITKDFPKEELYGLTSQVRRSAVSIPSNIAEGCSRSSNKELIRFLEIALGSSFELETQLLVAIDLGIAPKDKGISILNDLKILQKRINAFRNTIKHQ